MIREKRGRIFGACADVDTKLARPSYQCMIIELKAPTYTCYVYICMYVMYIYLCIYMYIYILFILYIYIKNIYICMSCIYAQQATDKFYQIPRSASAASLSRYMYMFVYTYLYNRMHGGRNICSKRPFSPLTE